MTMRMLYWILMLLWVICVGWHGYNVGFTLYFSGSLLEFILFVLLGWKSFGPPIDG